MRVLYLIISTGKYHSTRVKAVLESWGSSRLDQLLVMSDAPGEYPQIVNLGVPSDYGSASLKTVTALRALRGTEYDNFEWYFVGDDDTLVYVHNLESFLLRRDPSIPVCYGQLLHHYPEDRSLGYPSGGAGYVLSRPALQALYPTFEDAVMYPFGDVTIGRCLERAKVPVLNVDGFHSQPPEVVRKELAERSFVPNYMFLTFHYIKPDRMAELLKHPPEL